MNIKFKKLRTLKLLILTLICLCMMVGVAMAGNSQISLDRSRTYTIWASVVVENTTAYNVRNISVTVPLVSNQDLPWQEVIGEELNPTPTSVELDEDGNRVATYEIDLLLPGETMTFVQELAVDNYTGTYNALSNGSTLSDEEREKYLAVTDTIQADDKDIVNFATSATFSSDNDYVQAKLLFAAVNQYMKYSTADKEDRSAVSALRTANGNCVDYANFLVAAARAVGIPARVQGGFLYDSSILNTDGAINASGLVNADNLRHNWVEFFIEDVGWIVADPTFVYEATINGVKEKLVDWDKFGQISEDGRLIATGEYDESKTSISYTYVGKDLSVSYISELALYSTILPFVDLQDHWAASAVLSLRNYEDPIVQGKTGNYFGIDENITRGELATMINRVLATQGKTASDDATVVFSDLSTSHWAYSDINMAVNYGYMSGYPDGTFKPNQNVSRTEIVAILNNLLNPYAAGVTPFTDLDTDGYLWAKSAIESMYHAGLVSGISSTEFGVALPVTRGEAAVFIDRWMKSEYY